MNRSSSLTLLPSFDFVKFIPLRAFYPDSSDILVDPSLYELTLQTSHRKLRDAHRNLLISTGKGNRECSSKEYEMRVVDEVTGNCKTFDVEENNDVLDTEWMQRLAEESNPEIQSLRKHIAELRICYLQLLKACKLFLEFSGLSENQVAKVLEYPDFGRKPLDEDECRIQINRFLIESKRVKERVLASRNEFTTHCSSAAIDNISADVRKDDDQISSAKSTIDGKFILNSEPFQLHPIVLEKANLLDATSALVFSSPKECLIKNDDFIANQTPPVKKNRRLMSSRRYSNQGTLNLDSPKMLQNLQTINELDAAFQAMANASDDALLIQAVCFVEKKLKPPKGIEVQSQTIFTHSWDQSRHTNFRIFLDSFDSEFADEFGSSNLFSSFVRSTGENLNKGATISTHCSIGLDCLNGELFDFQNEFAVKKYDTNCDDPLVKSDCESFENYEFLFEPYDDDSEVQHSLLQDKNERCSVSPKAVVESLVNAKPSLHRKNVGSLLKKAPLKSSMSCLSAFDTAWNDSEFSQIDYHCIKNLNYQRNGANESYYKQTCNLASENVESKHKNLDFCSTMDFVAKEITEQEQILDVKVIKLLGTGAFGRVYLSEDKLGQFIAMKTIFVESSQKSLLKLVAMEVSMLRKMKHPNIVRYIGLYKTPSDPNVFNIAMEYVDGGSLAHFIQDNGICEESFSAGIIFQVLKGVAYLHEENIIHRGVIPCFYCLNG